MNSKMSITKEENENIGDLKRKKEKKSDQLNGVNLSDFHPTKRGSRVFFSTANSARTKIKKSPRPKTPQN